MRTKIEVVCMCCNKHLETKEGFGVEGVSSGLCDDCKVIHYPQFYPELVAQEILSGEPT
jgi:hypothetical protein